MNTTLSVGIPIYNEEKNILNLLRSIKEQVQKTYEIQEIILYNDGSTDNTANIVLSEIKKDKYLKKQVKFIDSKTNHGKSHGLSVIKKNIISEIIVLLDSDIILSDPHTFERIVESFEDPALGLITTWYKYQYYNPTHLLSRVLDFSSSFLINLGKYKSFYHANGQVMALKKEVLAQIKLYKGMVRIDAYIYLKVVELGYKYLFLRSVYVTDTKDIRRLNFKWFVKVQSRTHAMPSNVKSNLAKDVYFSETDLATSRLLIAFLETVLEKPVSGAIYFTYKLMSKTVNWRGKPGHYLWRN
jgi:glycosyltransferase involved in cell wall biosynthesis